ncbi:MAG: HAD family hydrolase [Flavobacteriaceae bacterium]|nr:HAD family hydrolase [Flavobacteriaceae bacterium]
MSFDYSNIKVIAFDADDTLWINETYYREGENKFYKLMSAYETENKLDQELFKKEMENLPLYGYGIKSFMLSMIESALELSNYKINPKIIEEVINIGKDMLEKPIELLDGVEETLQTLNPKYKIILATKGDLLDQERKLEKSGLEKYFHHIEILSEKKRENYKKLIKHLDIAPSEFLMIGNSLKSDVLPLIEIGAHAIHIPFHTTWAYEMVEHNGEGYKTINHLTDVLRML